MVGNTWAQESETVACSHGTWEAGSLGLVVLFDMNFNCFLQPTCSGKSDHLKPPAYKIVPKERIIYLKIAFNGFSTQTVSPSQKRQLESSIYAFPFSYSFLVSVLVLPQSLYLCHTFVIISKSCDHLNILYIVFSLYYQCEVLEHSNIYYVSHLFNLNLLSKLQQALFCRKSFHISGFTTEVVRNTSRCYFFLTVWLPN